MYRSKIKQKNKIKKGFQEDKKKLQSAKKLPEREVPVVKDDEKKRNMLKKLKNDMKVQPIKSARDQVEKTEGQSQYTMVPPGLTLFCGSSGSGKTVSICNILSKKTMLKNYFDKIIVFSLSPCDMLLDALQLDKKNFIQDDDPSKVQRILEQQKKLIENEKFEHVPHVLIILDDIIQSRTFLRSKVLSELAFAGTHSKISTWIATQSYMSVPRAIRVNCHACLLFSGCKLSELDRYEAEWGSQYLNKKQFRKLVQYALHDNYDFLFANNTNPDRSRKFMKGFHEAIVIDKNNPQW